MIKDIYFDDFFGPGWPSQAELKPYFFAPPKGRGWFHNSGNDGGSIELLGVDNTENLPQFKGRIDITLTLYGNPDHGVFLMYQKYGDGKAVCFHSKGDMTRLREWVRTLHDDPMPVGLFIPFEKGWEAVKEFMDTEGQLPNSIEWVNALDLPPNTFPDPMDLDD